MTILRNVALGVAAMAGISILIPAAFADPGDKSRHPICSSFAKHAERWENAAKFNGCKIKGDKLEVQHYQWCMNTSDAEFRVRSPTAGGYKASLEKSCSQQLRRPIRL